MAFRAQHATNESAHQSLQQLDAIQMSKAAALHEEGQARLEQDDYEAAINLFRQAAALDIQNQEYISEYGSLLAEVKRADEATQVLQLAVQRFPEEGFEKYMYLGQLLQGEAAIQNLEKGLQIVKLQISDEADSMEADALSAQLACGLCSLAEMYMQSEKGIEEVAPQCEDLLQQAQQADKRSPEPLQVLASLRHEQGRLDEALQFLRQSVALWWRPPKEGASLEDSLSEDRTEDNAEAMEEDLAVPSFEFRFECAKLLIQLDESTDTAIEIMEELLQENDQTVHLYFLLAMAHHAGSNPEAALEYIGEGQELMQRLNVADDDLAASSFRKLKDDITQCKADKGGT